MPRIGVTTDIERNNEEPDTKYDYCNRCWSIALSTEEDAQEYVEAIFGTHHKPEVTGYDLDHPPYGDGYECDECGCEMDDDGNCIEED